VSGFFKHQSMRKYVRSIARARPAVASTCEHPCGAGSGGQQQVDGSQSIWFKGLWGVGAGQVKLVAEDHSSAGADLASSDPVCYIAGVAHDSSKGRVVVLGTQGVRIVSETTAVIQPDDTSISGVDIQVADEKEIRFMQGQYCTQKMVMAKDAITITGSTSVVIQCNQQITLQVAGGTSSITLSPEGITMQAPMIQLN